MTTSSLIFVDARVSDYAQLMAHLPTTAEVVVLDSATDGLQQMADYLAGRTGIEAMHVVSHGSQGALYLGNARVDGAYLTSHSVQLANIGNSLTETGDILLYGCNVAQGDAGLQLIRSLANLTGADVAASDDLTGLEGDKQLEQATGSIEANRLGLNGLAVNLASVSGIVTTDFGGNDSGQSITLQADGKILVAGYSNSDFALVRYNPNGTLDTAFSNDGKLTTDFGMGYDSGHSVAVQADGKILVAGYSYQDAYNNSDFALVRYNTDGTLDATFSGDGKLITAIGTGTDAGASITVQADGKILVAGSSYRDGYRGSDVALVRYNIDGTLDTAFSGDGKVTTAVGTGYDYGKDITVQSDGKILVAGYSANGSFSNFALIRYNPDGTLDASLSGDTFYYGDGKVTTAIGADYYDVGFSVAVQANGKILVAGFSDNGSNYDFGLVRYNANGTLDTTFSDDGRVITAIGSSNDLGYSVTVQADGKILVGGYSVNSSGDSDFALVRYNNNGSLDTSFSGYGKLITNISSSDDFGFSVTVQTDGKILVAGQSDNGSNRDFALVRYNTNGTLDTTFGTKAHNTNNIVTGTVTIGGVVTQGQVLTASNTLADADGLGTISYQWKANGTAITGATGSIYTLSQSDVGKIITVTANYTDGQGTTEAVTSRATASVANVNDSPTGNVMISGTATQGQTLTTVNTLTDADGLGTISYQWKANGISITGATGLTYTLGQGDVGKTISITASYIDALGTAESKSSASTSMVNALETVVKGGTGNDTLTVKPGNAKVHAGAGIDTVLLPLFPNEFKFNSDQGNQVVGHYGANHTLELNDVEYVQFGSGTFKTKLALSDLTSGLAQEQLGLLTDLYLAFFGRAPDVEGLEYWQRQLLDHDLKTEGQSKNLLQMAKDFAWSTEAQALYPANANNQDFVQIVYQNCFGRNPDTGGWDYRTNKLNGLGKTDLSDRGAFVAEVILGAYAPSSGAGDRDLLTNKHNVAMYYVNQLATQPEEGYDASINDLLAKLTSDNVTQAKAEDVIDYAFAQPVSLAGVVNDSVLLNSLWG